MTATPRIPQAKITGLYGAMLKRFSTKKFGKVAAPLGVYWHNRQVLSAYTAISGRARKWDDCDASLKSFAHMAVASMVGCTWCLDFGYFQANDENLDLTKAREIPRWRQSGSFTPLERDVMAYAEAMTQTPPAVTDEMSVRLLEQLGPAALVELTAYISLANFWTRTNVAFGVESDGFAAACGLQPLAEPATGPRTPSTSR